MTNFTGLYKVRDAKYEDHNFILATFLRGLYYGDSWFSGIEKNVFMQNYKPVAETLLSLKTTIQVACLPEDEDVILGYSILSHDFQTIHWVYVKNRWRKKGIAKALLPKYPSTVSHLTSVGKELLHKFESKPTFNPFKI